MNREKRPGLFLQIAAVLLCLCMISTHFTTGLYAKYTNRATRSDAARAAKLDVSAAVLEVEKTTASGGSESGSEIEPAGEHGELPEVEVPDEETPDDDPFTRLYQIDLDNASEVAVRSAIVLTFPAGIKFDAADVVKNTAAEGEAPNYVVDESTIVTIKPNTLKIESKDIAPLTPVTLLIRAHIDIDSLITALPAANPPLAALDDQSEPFSNENMSSLIGSLLFELRVTFTQID